MHAFWVFRVNSRLGNTPFLVYFSKCMWSKYTTAWFISFPLSVYRQVHQITASKCAPFQLKWLWSPRPLPAMTVEWVARTVTVVKACTQRERIMIRKSRMTSHACVKIAAVEDHFSSPCLRYELPRSVRGQESTTSSAHSVAQNTSARRSTIVIPGPSFTRKICQSAFWTSCRLQMKVSTYLMVCGAF